MQKIREWMEQNPDGANELRRQNRSYTFFREVQLSDKDEAVGAQGVPLTPGRSIAVDKALHVYGTPFFIEGELPIEIGAIEDAVPPADDRAGHRLGHRRTRARRSLFRRRRGGGQGGRPAAGTMRALSCWSRRASIPSRAAARLPVPDERPSEKIAKLFPQDESAEGSSAASRRSAATTNAPAAGARRAVPARLRNRPVPLPAARSEGSPSEPRRISAAPSPSPHPMKRRPPSSIPDLPAAAAQARPERRGAALWESVAQAGQAAAQDSRRAGQAARLLDGERLAPSCCLAATRRSPVKIAPPPKPQAPPLAPIGRRERAQLSRGRQEIDARHRSARHDADPRASRAVRLPAARPP